jgi:hypothetical protein
VCKVVSYESLTARDEPLHYGIHMRYTIRRSLAFVITIGGLVAFTTSTPAGGVTEQQGLDALLLRYDTEPDEAAREKLAARIDAIAHQKYATVSRMYWHVDLASAKAAARQQGRPILHLRMLGSLEEDLSCANSRLFRATLYANQDLSRFLRERFVLYWSSERPVPRVTIDYGDGRILERTTTGNSAHYVLDEDGHVLDVLPGLYAAVAFRRELEGSLALAGDGRGKSERDRAGLIADYHRQRASAAQRDWERLAGVRWVSGLRQGGNETSLAAAQRATITKAAIELRDLRVFAKGMAPESIPDDQIEAWSTAGRLLYSAGNAKEPPAQGRSTPSRDGVLDDSSRALVVRLHNAASPELRASDKDLRAIMARLDQTILADTALNQLRLRPQISREIVRAEGRIDFSTLNAWIYARVFRTPREDAWLGLLQRDTFTGLPGDGVVVRSARRDVR